MSLSRARTMMPPSRPLLRCTFHARRQVCEDRGMFVPDPARHPVDQYLDAAKRAQAAGVDTAPIALATADSSGRPSVRIVLLRGADARGFVFYTNYGSRKAR